MLALQFFALLFYSSLPSPVEFLDSNQALSAWRSRASPPIMVPTMGALHEGHASLVRQAAQLASLQDNPAGCIVSIFVNPTQFNDPKDLARYPRTLEADLDLCRAAGAAAVYAPAPHDIYPPDVSIESPPLPPVALLPCLEDTHRPGHFAGVAQVVLRLFRLVQPVTAIFGEKDWQQLQVITRMSAAHHPSTHILPSPTVREPDGLAMSSRNRFLSPSDRVRALAISRALRVAAEEPSPDAAEHAMRRILEEGGAQAEYAVIRDASTLLRPRAADSPPTAWRALVAARVGAVRLIDNAPWPSR